MSKNWRLLVMNFAAEIAADLGNSQLAESIRAWKVPFMDGGGGYIARRPSAEESRTTGQSYFLIPGPTLQGFEKPAKGETILIGIPPSAWDEPKDEGCRCKSRG